jgi:hypothetical protein
VGPQRAARRREIIMTTAGPHFPPDEDPALPDDAPEEGARRLLEAARPKLEDLEQEYGYERLLEWAAAYVAMGDPTDVEGFLVFAGRQVTPK